MSRAVRTRTHVRLPQSGTLLPTSCCVAAPGAQGRGAMTSGAAGEAMPPLHYRLERTLEEHAGSVASVKFSPDGQWCVCGICSALGGT